MSDNDPKFAIEEVEAVSAPKRAFVEDAVEETPAEKLERKRDYLEGFLAAKPQAVSPAEPGTRPSFIRLACCVACRSPAPRAIWFRCRRTTISPHSRRHRPPPTCPVTFRPWHVVPGAGIIPSAATRSIY